MGGPVVPWMRSFLKISALLALGFTHFVPVVSAADAPASNAAAQAASENKGSKLSPPAEESEKTRNFYQVLEDVLADFEYDLRNGEVNGLRELSIRNIATSENIPPSFKNHIELLVSERVLKHGNKTKIIQCVPCRSRKAMLSGDNVMISTPDSNPAELARRAKLAGIANFMDIAFAYQPTGMILSISTMDAENGAIQWSKSYNSETSRAAALRRGVDYTQIDPNRRADEYAPTQLYRPTIYYMFEPDGGSTQTGVIGFGFRLVERYDNRTKEVGFEANYFLNSVVLAGGTAPTTSVYSGFNLTLLFVHAWNFIGDIEVFNRPRQSLYLAVGGTYASGFLGLLFRGGYEWRLGKHWAVNGNIGYRPLGTQFISGTASGTISGVEWGFGISALL